MKRLLLFSVLLSLLVSCGGRKQIEKQLTTGNYDVAISNALRKLESNKDKKRKQKFVVLLEDAYQKVVARDLNTIAHLEKDGNPEQYKAIYELYANLDARQEAIKPVLPLKIGNKYLTLDFDDYTDELVDYRYKTSDYLLDQGIALLDSENKYNAREAYQLFKYIDKINPNFEEVNELISEAIEVGTDYVSVNIENQTQQIIPQRLENELLDFNTYGLNNFWTVYHANAQDQIDYDFAMTLALTQINVSPERVNERQILRRKQIVDGWEYLLDENGNVQKDSLGNDIKVDKIITVKARVFETIQSKSSQVVGTIIYKDLKSNQVIDSFDIDSGFVFENLFAEFRGDRRALTQNDRALLRNRPLPFPSSEQLVYDTGEDLKLKLKRIINSYNFRG
ncbi:MAG: hypothetical protein ACWA5P_00730 [bacterium]